MIKFDRFSPKEKKIYYRNTSSEILPVRVEIYEGYTNSFIISSEIDLDPRFLYFTNVPANWKNMRAYFYDRRSNDLLAPFVFDGDKSVEEVDIDGYIKKIQHNNDKWQQSGVNEVLTEHFCDRNYENIVDVDEGDVVLDIGFNYGIFSLGALKNGAKKIYGFEPNKYIFERLKDYPKKGNEVELYNYVVSDKEGSVTFYESSNTLSSSIYQSTGNFKQSYDVKSINLYDFIIEKEISHIDFLKVDCEGMEYRIFESIPDEFFCTIKKIHVEFHNNSGEEIKILTDKLDRNGFEWVLEKGKTLTSKVGLIFAKNKKYKPRKIALISSFCNDNQKIDVLKRNINILKEMGIDVLVITPLPLPIEVQKMCDYYFLTKDNPVLDWPDRATCFWREFQTKDQKIKITTTKPDYGFAGLTQIRQSSEIALSMNYDHFYHIIYDLVFDNTVLDEFKKTEKFLVYPSKRGKVTWEVGLHLISINKQNLKNFISNITLESYLNCPNADAFNWLFQSRPILKYDIANTPVEDEIYYYDKVDQFNYSQTNVFKFYIEKYEVDTINVKLFFYDVSIESELTIIVDGEPTKYDLKNLQVIDLGFNSSNIKKTEIRFLDYVQDITQDLVSVKHNIMEIVNK